MGGERDGRGDRDGVAVVAACDGGAVGVEKEMGEPPFSFHFLFFPSNAFFPSMFISLHAAAWLGRYAALVGGDGPALLSFTDLVARHPCNACAAGF